jgi:membrane fusion protein, multidrug efflux system
MADTTTPATERMDSPANDEVVRRFPLTKTGTTRRRDLSKRQRLFVALVTVLLLSAFGYGVYWWFVASRYVTTDDAYVDATAAQITPLISAPVAEVRVNDTQQVLAGDVLVVLDDSDARLALQQAQAQLSQTIRRVQGYFANDTALTAEVSARAAAIEGARSDLVRAQADFERRKALAEGGAVSTEDLTTAENRLREATATLIASQAQRRSAEGSRDVNKALIAGVPVDANPEVLAARAQLAEAELNLERTVIRAPRPRHVADRTGVHQRAVYQEVDRL